MNPHNNDSSPPEHSKYSLSVEQASEIFARAGTPRSLRTITRYCSRGHLECIKVDTEQNEKYLINRKSIDRRIQELKQIAKSRHVSTRPDESRHDESRLDTSEKDDPGFHKGERAELEKKIESLNAQIMDLTITNRAKDQFLELFKSERGKLFDQVAQQSKRLGELETRLELSAGGIQPNLPAAKPQPPDDSEARVEHQGPSKNPRPDPDGDSLASPPA